ncbi:hypothetical protein [Henriciella marina]|uniref:hypothetical protein n=1 Tax=Henriciella marina TaxID=453851 RepID=UPI00036126AF|nr:hypothetical protein [Henriciella marina]
MDKSLDIGAVIGDTFGVIGRKFVDLATLGVLIVGVPTLLVTFFSSQAMERTVEQGALDLNFSFGLFLANILYAVFPFMLQAAVVYLTVASLNRGRSGLGDAIGTALRAFFPLLVVSILMSIGLTIGFLLLIIPGLILLTVWAVVVPALVVDRAGIFGSFGRSADLTRGSRWRIFGLILLGYIAMFVIAALFGLLAVGASAGSVVAGDGGFNASGLIAGVVIDTALAIVAAVGVSVLYVHLREMKDGTRVDAIGDVFS